MITTKKDLSVLIYGQAKEEFKELIIKAATVETMLASEPDLIPLDAFLDFTGTVAALFDIYSTNINHNRATSYNKIKFVFTALKTFRENTAKNLSYQRPDIINAMNQTYSVALSIFNKITVGDTAPV